VSGYFGCYFGYSGRALWVDLGAGSGCGARHLPLSEDVLRRFVGGVGLGTYLLYGLSQAAEPGEGRGEGSALAGPLAPASPLIFATSPFVGTSLTTSTKYAVLARSPLTGFIGDSLSGGSVAIALKRAGWDALALVGRAPELSYLVVDGEAVALRPAGHLRGLSAREAEAAIQRELGDEGFRVAAIGVAGEHLVRYATIAGEGRHAGRGGLGAVLGSKGLKAMAVRGTRRIPVADPEGLQRAAAELARRSLGPATGKWRQIGTTANLLTFHRLGVLPGPNFRASGLADPEPLSGESLLQERLARRSACAACTIGCERVFRTRSGPRAEGRLEYETLFAFGPLCGVEDPDAVIRAAALCDDLGLDTLSTGATIAWTLESAERGLLTPADADGLDLRFGNAEAVLGLIPRIARREGLGDLLAEGSREAARRLGGGSEAWAMHVKGLELPGYDPRGLKTLALGLATAARGACHNRSGAYEADFSAQVDRFRADASRGPIAAASEDAAAVLDSLILCKFLRRCFADLYAEAADLYRLVAGFDVSAGDLRLVGERVVNLKKLYNVRAGWTRADDTLPPRLLEEPLGSGVGAGVRLTAAELDLMLDAYYAARGWTPEGLIPEAKLRSLELPTGPSGTRPDGSPPRCCR